MKILYDSQIFALQKFGGISRYFVELINHLPTGFNPVTSLRCSENVYIDASHRAFHYVFNYPFRRHRRRVHNAFNSRSDVYSLRRSKADLFHPTYYDPYFLRYLKGPYIITVHDMIHERFAHLFPNDTTYLDKEKTIKGADRIIAISESTKKDIVDIYGISENKIDIVYHGYSLNYNSITPVSNLPERYVLFVGQRYHYKNFKRFVEAFAILSQAHPDLYLVCTGRPFSAEEQAEFKRLGITNKVCQMFVSDGELAYLYKNALCFVFPSLYEGFGIPILEAFAARCPVVLSDTSCFPEIAQNAAAYFNPLEPESMALSIRSVIEDSELRGRLVECGTERLKAFSLDKMARETSMAYQRVLV